MDDEKENYNQLEDYMEETINQIKKECKEKEEPDIEEGTNNFIFCNIILFLIWLPTFLYGFFSVYPLTAVVVLVMGKVVKTYDTPGIKWYWPVGSEFKVISLRLNTFEVKDLMIPDANGSPLKVSSVVTYQIVNPKLAIFAVNDLDQFLIDQALDVTKKVVSKFKYSSQNKSEPTLLNDTVVIGQLLKNLLQIKTNVAGVKITRMELMEFSFDKSVAQDLLKVQLAQAKIEARKMIADASSLLVKDAIIKMEQEGLY